MKKINNNECLLKFGEYIKEAREIRGYTQSDIASMLNITQSYYSLIENGKKNVDLVLAIKICQELKINMKEFMKMYL